VTNAAAGILFVLRIKRARPLFCPIGPNEATREASVAVPFTFFAGHELVGEHIIDSLHVPEQAIVNCMGEIINRSIVTGPTGF
jgi:hypothetical protein